MSGIDYLADTNALIYLLSGNPCMEPYLSARLGVSVISEMGLLSFPGISPDETNTIRSFLGECASLLLDTAVKERTISLRKQYRIKLPDAIIAATAVEKGLPLLTADRGFTKIEELSLELLQP